MLNMKTWYQHNEAVVLSWNSTANTTHYNLYFDKKNSSGEYERIDHTVFYAKSGVSYVFPDGEYRVLLQSTNANAYTDDGSTWRFADSSWYYFNVGSDPGKPALLNMKSQYQHNEAVAALGHNFVGGVCTRCGADDPNYNPPMPKDPCEGYTDINRNGWYHTAADFAIERGIMGSTQTNALTFEPNTACTRSMIVSILYRLSDSPKVSFEAKFPDVEAGKWFSNAVIWAYQNGIVSGYGDCNFGPNDKITREQMAVILKGYADFMGKNTDKIADLSEFPDCAKVTWSKAAVRWAVAEGLISGKAQGGKTMLDPQGNATRAEVASILMRFIQNIAAE